MILLDTEHLTILQMKSSDRRNRLVARMGLTVDELFAAPIVGIEEQMRGWLSSITKERQARRQIASYRDLGGLFEFFAAFEIAPFDDAAVDVFERFNRSRISTADRKIAAIAIANDALLLIANRRDYEQVPGLRFENWLD